ncbi:MAG: hypothetical protein CBB78_002065 [Roseibacillus sp. TMED18]|nr:MAG: hypothetical protein CBB78_002065 [Roseibacillus sp. TMED18]
MPEEFGRSSPAHHHPLTVAVVVGSFAMAVGLVVRISGMSLLIERQILSSYMELGFPVNTVGQPWWAVLVLLALTYGIALVLLQVPGFLRRLLFFLSCLVLVVSASPVVALWGLFWSPVVAVFCLSWSAACAVLWARYHPMPCEIDGT